MTVTPGQLVIYDCGPVHRWRLTVVDRVTARLAITPVGRFRLSDGRGSGEQPGRIVPVEGEAAERWDREVARRVFDAAARALLRHAYDDRQATREALERAAALAQQALYVLENTP